MKRTVTALGLSAALALALWGCTKQDQTPVEDPAPESAVEEVSRETLETPEAREDLAPEGLEGVRGRYVVLPDPYHTAPHALYKDESISALSVVDLHNTLILSWGVSNGFIGPTLLEARSTQTGEAFFQTEVEGYAYAVEETGELPENYRVVQPERIVYLTSGDESKQEIYTVPMAIADSFFALPFNGAPYDYARDRDRIAWCADDGVYVATGSGEEPELILPVSDIAPLLAQGPDLALSGERDEYTIPEWGETDYHYITPLFLNGGRQVVATAVALPRGQETMEPVCLFVAWADLETGETGHSALQFATYAMPAARYRGGAVSYNAFPGVCILEIAGEGCELSVIPYSDEYYLDERSWDYETFYRVRAGEQGDQELYRYTRDNPDDGDVLLTSDREYLSLWWMDDRYALCETGYTDPKVSDLLLIPLG